MPKRKPKPARKRTWVAPAPGSLKLRDLVKIRYHPSLRGRVVELRGALGPKGALVYRLLLGRDPDPHYVEVLEDQIVAVAVDSPRAEEHLR